MIDEVINFLHSTETRFVSYCKEHCGSGPEYNNWKIDDLGIVRNAIIRGGTFEKASAVYCDIEVDTPPLLLKNMKLKKDRMRALVLEMTIFPDNPHIPKIYLELRANYTDELNLGGGTDIFPYYKENNDHIEFTETMQQICSAHNMDYTALQKVRADFFRSKFTGEKVGAHSGIYFFQLEADKLPFYRDMTDAFFDGYDTIINKHKASTFTDADKVYQHKIHGDWAEWIMIEDDGTLFGLQKGIPPEALLGAILPPVARF